MDSDVEAMANAILRQSQIRNCTEVLYLPYDTPIEYGRWIVLDPVPLKNILHLWNFLGLYSNPDVIDIKDVNHYRYGRNQSIGIIIYIDAESATKDLVRIKYMLSEHNVSCTKASDFFHYINNVNLVTEEDDEKTIRLSVHTCELYRERLTSIHGKDKENRIKDTVERGETDIKKQQSKFTHLYLLQKFGEVESVVGMRFRYKTRACSIAAVWGLSDLHIANYDFFAEHVSMDTVFQFDEFPFISAIRSNTKFEIPQCSYDIAYLTWSLAAHCDVSPVYTFKYNVKQLKIAISKSRHATPCLTMGLECNFYSLGPILHCTNCASISPNPNYALAEDETSEQNGSKDETSEQNGSKDETSEQNGSKERCSNVMLEQSENDAIIDDLLIITYSYNKDDPDLNFSDDHF